MRDYGLLENLQEFTAYVLGGSKVPFVPYNESGDWEEWLPRYENQTTKLGQETSGCTVWGSQNQLETLYRFLYNEEPNYSERFTYLNVPVDPARGTDPQRTYEAIRKHGVVDERDLPMTDSLAEYLDDSDITGSLRAKGQYWLQRHEYKHEWLWIRRPQNYIEILKDALPTGPIGVSVSAWNRVGDEYVSYGDVNNHYCLLYKIDEDGHPWIFDSYDHSKKKLSKDHNIRRAKRIWLNKRTPRAMRRHISILQSVINMLMQKKTLLDVCNSYIGKDATPKDNTPDEVACVDTGSTILREVYPHVPHEVSTIVMDAWLSKPENGFRRVFEPEPEAIIISPTRGSKIGHMGFVMDDDTIASNTSFGIHKGKFIKNYTYPSWKNYYQTKLGLEIHMYKKV